MDEARAVGTGEHSDPRHGRLCTPALPTIGDRSPDQDPVAACAIFGEFPLATIQCGNCFFTPAEWKRFLEDGSFPVPG